MSLKDLKTVFGNTDRSTKWKFITQCTVQPSSFIKVFGSDLLKPGQCLQFWLTGDSLNFLSVQNLSDRLDRIERSQLPEMERKVQKAIEAPLSQVFVNSHLIASDLDFNLISLLK